MNTSVLKTGHLFPVGALSSFVVIRSTGERMAMCRIVSLLLLVAIAPVSAVRADSDGYYCAGRGYLAYETRWSSGSTGHLLHVVTFSSARGFARLAPIRLDDFQVHGMTCGAGAVELEGWTTGYTISIADPEHPTVTARATRFDPRTGKEAANLGHWSRAGVTDLHADGAPGEFQLVIARVERAVAGGIEHYTLTDVVWRSSSPGESRLRGSERLFAGVFLETVD
jgi:hypothetical protein